MLNLVCRLRHRSRLPSRPGPPRSLVNPPRIKKPISRCFSKSLAHKTDLSKYNPLNDDFNAVQLVDQKALSQAMSFKAPTDDQIRSLVEAVNKEKARNGEQSKEAPKDPRANEINQKLKTAIASSNYQLAVDIWLDMLSDKIFPNIDTFCLMMQLFVTVRRYEASQKLIEMMAELKIPKNLSFVNLIMKWASQEKDPQRAATEWKYLHTASIAPNIRTLDYYMSSYGIPESQLGSPPQDNDHLTKALHIFSEYTKKYNLEPDAHMHSSLIELLLQYGKEEIALKRYEAMKSKKLPLPTNYTFQIMMKYYLRKRDYKQVQKIFDSINEEFGLFPDANNYESLMVMKLAIFEEGSDSATSLPEKKAAFMSGMELIETMCIEAYTANHSMVRRLMEAGLIVGESKSLERIWAILPKIRVMPDRAMLNILVNAICKIDKNPDRAFAYMLKAKELYQLPSSSDMYVSLISTYGAKHDMPKVLSIYKRMIFEEKIKPTPATFVAMISAYAQSGHREAIIMMLKKPDLHGIPSINRFLFENLIDEFNRYGLKAMDSLYKFDWMKLKGMEDQEHVLRSLNRALNSKM